MPAHDAAPGTGASIIGGMDPPTLSMNDCYYDIVNEPGLNPELGATHFPLGSGQVRLLQYAATISWPKPDFEYWLEFVANYFVPDAILRYQVWNSETYDHRIYDIPAQTMARFLHRRYQGALRSMRTHLGRTNEQRCNPSVFPPSATALYGGDKYRYDQLGTTHLVQSDQVQQLNMYNNGWLTQRICTVYACLMPHTRVVFKPDPVSGDTIPRLETQLRIKHLFFGCLNQINYLPLSALNIRRTEHKLPKEVVDKIVADARRGYSKTEDIPEQVSQNYTPPLDETNTRSVVPPVDFSEPVMRMLEISDRISLLGPLMEIYLNEGKGPLDACPLTRSAQVFLRKSVARRR